MNEIEAYIRLREDTAANWTATNPVLLNGEGGFERDTGRVKIGRNGIAWNTLPYLDASTAAHIAATNGAHGATRRLITFVPRDPTTVPVIPGNLCGREIQRGMNVYGFTEWSGVVVAGPHEATGGVDGMGAGVVTIPSGTGVIYVGLGIIGGLTPGASQTVSVRIKPTVTITLTPFLDFSSSSTGWVGSVTGTPVVCLAGVETAIKMTATVPAGANTVTMLLSSSNPAAANTIRASVVSLRPSTLFPGSNGILANISGYGSVEMNVNGSLCARASMGAAIITGPDGGYSNVNVPIGPYVSLPANTWRRASTRAWRSSSASEVDIHMWAGGGSFAGSDYVRSLALPSVMTESFVVSVPMPPGLDHVGMTLAPANGTATTLYPILIEDLSYA